MAGRLPNWRAAYAGFRAGAGRATAVIVGDSLEIYFPGANAHTADMWPTRTGLDLAVRGGKTWASRYMPTHDLDGTGSDHGPWGEGNASAPPYTITDPWTYTGSHAVRPGSGGLGERSTELNNGATISIPAPSWATHAQVHFRFTSAGASCSMQVQSNGIVVNSASGSTVEQRQMEVALVGSGNTLLITNTGTLTNVNVDGVTWQPRTAIPTITIGATAGGSGFLGNTATVSLTGVTTGDLMVLWAVMGNASPNAAIAVPTGWTDRGSVLVGQSGYRVCTRVKQSGDTSVVVGGGTLAVATEAEMVSFGGADWGEISVSVTSASASSLDPAAVTIDNTRSYSLLLVAGRPAGTTFTFPTFWTSAQSSNGAASAAIARRTGVSGSTDPGVISFSQGPQDCAVFHVELVSTAGAPPPEAYVEVIEASHGGYSAASYTAGSGTAVHNGVVITSLNRQTTPAYPAARPLALDDTANRWADAIALLAPQLVIFPLGGNDAQYDDTPTDFTHNLAAMVAAIDASCTAISVPLPDLLFVGYWFIDLSDFPAGLPPLVPGTAFDEPYWNTLVDAADALALTYGTRARFLDVRTAPRWVYTPYPGTVAHPYPSPPNPAVSGDGVHPNLLGHHTLGDLVAAILAEVGAAPGFFAVF